MHLYLLSLLDAHAIMATSIHEYPLLRTSDSGHALGREANDIRPHAFWNPSDVRSKTNDSNHFGKETIGSEMRTRVGEIVDLFRRYSML